MNRDCVHECVNTGALWRTVFSRMGNTGTPGQEKEGE